MPTLNLVDLRAYHGDEALKEGAVKKARWHREHSILDRSTYFSTNGKAKVCAVGCLTEDPGGGHHLYPEKWGIPEWLAYLEEKIFIGLPDGKMENWPVRFLAAIPAGADFEGLADRLAIRRLKEECLPLSGSWPELVRAEVVAAIEQCIAALEGKGSRDAAWGAAESAAHAAWSGTWGAAESAAESAALAASAAWSAAWGAEWGAEWGAAESAALAARTAERAKSAAWSGAYEREADRLIEELEALPVPKKDSTSE